MMKRPVWFSLAIVAGCSSNDPAPPGSTPTKKVVRGVDTQRIPVPNHGPKSMSGATDKVVRKTAQGEFEATLNGKVRHFKRFSPGENVAVYSSENGVGRVMMAATENDDDLPSISLRIRGVRLDRLQLPLTFPLEAREVARQRKAGAIIGSEDPTWELLYTTPDTQQWKLDAGSPAASGTLTLSQWRGKQLSGALRAQLTPTAKGVTQQIEVKDAEFAIELRLKGVEPGT